MLITVESLHNGHLGGRIFANNLFAETIFIVDCRKKKKERKRKTERKKEKKPQSSQKIDPAIIACLLVIIEKELARLALKSSQSRALK